jgi:putative heme-binding domain-containing protein
MRGCLAGLLTCVLVSAQSSRSLYQTHCAACHGRNGEGSRGPALRAAALQRANDVESLAALLRQGIPGTEMAAVAPQTIPDEALRELARYVLSLRTHFGGVSSGADRGALLFRGKGKCTNCHRVAGEGSASGPDLSDIGRLRDSDWIKDAIVNPEASIFDSFANYRWTIPIPDNYLLVDLVTKSGERVTGSRTNEDPFSIQLRDGNGRIRSFLKSDLAELNKRWGKSPMPSYRNVFSSEELNDLVAYLSGLRGLR